jgi:basic amino acid/polyamine antiporter, APA family
MRTKPLEASLKEASGSGGNTLKRSMGALDLTALGVGAIIGTGIFVLTGVAAAKYAGPAVVISFVISGLVAGLAALAYAELAAMVPVAGSAYAYAYSSMGEIIAWLIGWNLVLEYLIAAGAVAVGWSAYLKDLLKSMDVRIPEVISSSPIEGGIVNLPAVLITLLITYIAIRGTKGSAKATKVIVAVKLTVVLLFIIIGVFQVRPANWTPFAPFGFTGIMHGAAIIFFAYISFDAVSTAAEEVRNPKRDLPRGIISSLAISTFLYIIVAAVLTGMIKYNRLDTPSPIAEALFSTGIRWASALVSVGAIAGLTSVLLAVIFAQSRVFFAMSRDGLLPPVFAVIHKKYSTPYFDTLMVGIAVSLVSAFFPVDVIAQMANIGTLSALAIVSAGVIILRRKKPELPRPFKMPWVPILPGLSVIFCIYLMFNLPLVTWLRFVIWMAIGMYVYYGYGFSHSKLST